MNVNDYQAQALKTANSKDRKNEFFHLVLGLVGESGEIAEKIKKWVRDQDSDPTELDIEDLEKELGDVLWHVAVLGDYLGLSLEDIAATNIEKLKSRKARDVIKGSGDNR
jgi:NTP pyrophosphatase (non-canonical NTP hydrolase)